MDKKQFYETYCMRCGTQQCGGINDEEFSSGCLYRWNLDGADAATEIIRLNNKVMELATKLVYYEPVKHGEWIDKCVRAWHCSLCDCEIHKVRKVDGYCYDDLPKYCPDCGAKMSGGKK